MSAVPKIAVRPLVRPTFVPVLGDDYRDFCALQYDLTCELEATKEPRRALPFDDRSFERMMENLTGQPSRGPL